MTESYRAKMQRAKSQTYLKAVVSQPTQQSDIKVKLDKSSPTGIRPVKGKE
jgi:hypothetical protein